ncbi:hypothetical protein [Heliomarina baculiformis]|nr:hypothetical protein [Heliomarina baculiformis]
MLEDDQNQTPAQRALALLEDAWGYFTPVEKAEAETREPDLFDYAEVA